MSGEIAPWRGLSCSAEEVCLSEPTLGNSTEELRDKRPGTVARHSVDFLAVLPCQFGTDRADFSRKPLIAIDFYGAFSFSKDQSHEPG